MLETSSYGGLMWAAKYYGWKLIGGVIAASLGFMVLWPKTAKEGFARISATIVGSMLFGDPAVQSVNHYLPWMQLDTVQSQMPVFVMAGLPCWWVLGLVVRWFEKRKNKDIGEVVQEFN